MNGQHALQSNSTPPLTNLNKNLELSSRDLFSLLSKTSQGTEAQRVALSNLKSKPAVEVACFPFFEDACDGYTQLISDALDKVLMDGTNEDSEKVCIALLQSCQNDTLPESIRSIPKQFLFKFLEKMGLTSQASLPCFTRSSDSNQIVVHGLRELLHQNIRGTESDIEMEKSKSQANPKYEKITIGINSLPDSAREKIMLIYEYLQKNDERIDELLLSDARGFLISSDSWTCPIKYPFEMANIICGILSEANSTHPDVQVLQEILSQTPDEISQYDMKTYLMNAAKNYGCPIAATWCGQASYWGGAHVEWNRVRANDQMDRVIYISKAALQGHPAAIELLNIEATSNFLGHIEPLNDIYHPDARVTFWAWVEQVNVITEKIIRGINYVASALPVFSKQMELGIELHATFEERMEIGVDLLKSNLNFEKFSGARILQDLAQLVDHPLAREAQQVFDKLTSKTKPEEDNPPDEDSPVEEKDVKDKAGPFIDTRSLSKKNWEGGANARFDEL